ncbi:SPASM domain-containing protein [archaeon]|nr:SPASM domain-containing protein [archaeon]
MIKPFYAPKKFEEIYKHAKSRGKIIGLVTPMPLCFFEEDFREELVKNRSLHGGPCQLSSGSNFVVDYNGDILPCTHMTGFPVGNIFTNENVLKKENFLEMYNSPEEIPSKFREKMSRTASTKCDAPKCDQSCTGGCPLIWKVFDPEEEIPGIELQQEWDKVAKD